MKSLKLANKAIYSRIAVVILSALTVVIGFANVVRADIGDKPSTDIYVKNPPDSKYYIAMLSNERKRTIEFKPDKSLSDKENEAIRQVLQYKDDDGYALYARYVAAYSASNKTNSYRLSAGRGLLPPDDFKILIVTLDGEVKVSPTISQLGFHGKIIYNYKSNTIWEDRTNIFTRCIFWVLFYFFLTLLIEGLILKAFGLYNKENIRPFLTINIITQVILNIANMSWYLIRYDVYVFVWLGIELVILVTEAVWYSNRLVKHNGAMSVERNIIYGITANLVSAFADIPVLIYMALVPTTSRSLW